MNIKLKIHFLPLKTKDQLSHLRTNPILSSPVWFRYTLRDNNNAHFFFLESKPLRQRKFKSARLIGDYDKPWTAKKDPRMLWDKVFFVGLTVVGLGIGAYIIYSGWQSVENPPVSSHERFI
jgi:hypothetical protein